MEDIHRQAFREEAADLLIELEAALLELEDAPGDAELVNRVFRAMHTLKGSGAMFGFDGIAQFTHEVETVFDKVRSNELALNKTILDLTFQARDHVKLLLDADGEHSDALARDGEHSDALARDGEHSDALARDGEVILSGFRAAAGAAAPAPAPLAPAQPAALAYPTPAAVAVAGEGRVFRIRFQPKPGIYATGSNPAFLLDDLKALGQALVFAHAEGVPPLGELDPISCHVWWDVILNTESPESAIRDVFLFVEDDCELSIMPVEVSGDVEMKKLGEILVERGDITPKDISKALQAQKRLGVLLTEAGLIAEKSVEAALAEQDFVKQKQEQRKPDAASSLRVSAGKLDVLQDLVGELVIVQAQISQLAPGLGNPLMAALAEELERLSDDIRNSTLSIRMLPIGSTFSTYRRLVRDLSAEIGKEIDLFTSGEETELDKTVLDRLGDALVHLIRNSVDHGMEPANEREAAGKQRRGTIKLCAEHSGGDVVIQVIDDGRGIDPDKVRRKAVERGLIPENAGLSARETLELIFLPGFSTAQTVSSVSGRGVGMDVVKRVVNSMRGSIDLESELGKGSCVTIRLPLTLAIIDGLQVQVGSQSYVMPLDIVEECVELERASLGSDGRRRIINLRGEVAPFISLREWFRLTSTPPDIEQVVILNLDGSRIGIVVDHVVGEHQTVIKSLGPVFRKHEGFSGATIQGDGSMSLILDVKRIVRMALGEAR